MCIIGTTHQGGAAFQFQKLIETPRFLYKDATAAAAAEIAPLVPNRYDLSLGIQTTVGPPQVRDEREAPAAARLRRDLVRRVTAVQAHAPRAVLKQEAAAHSERR